MAYITVTTTNDYDVNDIRDMVWSGAADRVNDLTDDQLDTIIGILAEEYPDGIDETELNDFLWFEDDTYAEWLGFRSADALWGYDDDVDEEEEEEENEEEEDEEDEILENPDDDFEDAE